jgi:hypothetical protein
MVDSNKNDRNAEFAIDVDFEKRIQSFFEEILSFPLAVELVILSDEAYSEEIDAASMAELRLSTLQEKIKTLKGIAEKKINRIYVRKIGLKVNLVQIIREFLKAYYPNAPEGKISKAAEVFVEAYKCYVNLLAEEKLRRFFVRLCTETGTIFKWTGLPKQL